MKALHKIKNPYMYVGIVVAMDKCSRPRMNYERTISRISESVAEYFGITTDAMRTRTRKREFAEPRQIAIYLMHQNKVILREIGDYFRRDHTTCIHSENTVREMMDVDTDYYFKVQRLKTITELALMN